MTPAALRATRLRLGVTPSQLAAAAGCCGWHAVSRMERADTPERPSRAVRRALLEFQEEARDRRFREARRARAAAVWAGDPRHAVLKRAAAMLDRLDEGLLADWLLRARPERAVAVATGTAVHVLLRGGVEPYDVLREASLIDDPVFCDGYFGDRDYVWSPAPADLLP